jgi:hypothetical protein
VSAQAPAFGPSIGNDPKLPGALQGQGLQNTKTQLDISKFPLDVANAQTNIKQGENSIRQSQIGNVQELRKEFNALPEVKNYGETLSQMAKALRSPKGPQGDLAVIYAFAKAMDPGSVVREGEMDMANSTASLISQFKMKYKSFAEGKGLPPEVRHGLIESIRASGRAMNEAYAERYRQYRDQAQALGADPKQVVGNHLGDAFRDLEKNYITTAQRKQAEALEADGTEYELDEQGNPIPVLVGGSAGDPRKAALEQRINETDAFGSGMVGAADSMTFGLADEASAGINALGGALTGQGSFSDLYGRNVEDERAYQGALRERDPLASFSGNVLGSVGGLGLTSGVLRNAGRLDALATRGGGLGSDILYGAGYGAGSGDENRLGGAALGAGAAAGGNLLGRHVVAPAVRGAAGKLGYNPAPALPPGQAMVAQQALKANPEEVMGRLNQASELKLPYALADADPRLRSLAGSAVRKSPDAHALASETIGPRGQGQAERALGLINENLAPAGDISKITADATTRARAASKDMYGKAMQNPAPEDQVLGEMLQTPAGQQAARDAYSRALNAGEKPADLSFEVDSITGDPRLIANPNWRTLQYMKFELDRAAKTDPTLEPLRRRFTGRLGELNPDFKAANSQYEGIAKQGEAAQAGYGMTAPRVTPSQAQATLGNVTPEQLPYLRQGFASSLADTVERSNLGRDPYEAIFGSTAQRAKLGQVFPEGAGRFAQARGLEKDMSLTSRELLGGSPTQPRAEADKLFEAGGMADLAQDAMALASGTPPINMMRSKLFAGRGVFGAAADTMRMGMGKSAKQKADQIAPILLNQNPEEAAATLAEYLRQQAARNAYVQRTGMFGAGASTPIALGLTNR